MTPMLLPKDKVSPTCHPPLGAATATSLPPHASEFSQSTTSFWWDTPTALHHVLPYREGLNGLPFLRGLDLVSKEPGGERRAGGRGKLHGD